LDIFAGRLKRKNHDEKAGLRGWGSNGKARNGETDKNRFVFIRAISGDLDATAFRLALLIKPEFNAKTLGRKGAKETKAF